MAQCADPIRAGAEQALPALNPAAATPCPVCAGERIGTVCEVDTWARYQIVRCQTCALVFAAPRPTPAELDEFYTATYFRGTREGNLGYTDYRSLAEANARVMWNEAGRYAAGRLDKPGALLDVGCATGGFLAEACNDGWQGTGVELSDFAVKVARSEFRLNVIRGDIFAPELRTEEFDFITMWHVVEHLPDPLPALQRAHELLKPGGLLLIELPNWDSIGRMLKGARWSQLRPPEHINFFTPRSLRFAVGKAGLEIDRCTTHYPSLVNEAAVPRATRVLHQARAAAARILCGLGCGGYLRLLARKPARTS